MPERDPHSSRALALAPGDCALVAEFLKSIPADEVTVWFANPSDRALEAIYNPVNARLAGLTQPLNRGLISQVFITGLPLLEPDVSQGDHDPTIDGKLGQLTLAMMAAPIFCDDDVTGVLSAVQLQGGAQEQSLRHSHLSELERVALRLGKSLEKAAADSD